MVAVKINILLADPEVNSLFEVINEMKTKNCEFSLVDNGAAAQKEIRDHKTKFDIIFLSPDITKPSGLSVIKFAHQFAPGIPLFIMTSLSSTPDREVDLVDAGVSGMIAKPFGATQMMNALGPLFKSFDEGSVLELSKKFDDKVDEELEGKDQEFVAIQAKYFVSGSKCLFDVYVKLRENKFVKILQGGDPFEPERLLGYLKKGVEHFFIRKEAQEAYVSYCDKVSSAILKVEQIPLDKKFSLLFNQCESTLNTLVELGVNNETIAYSQRFTRNSIELLNHLGKKHDGIGKLLKDLTQFEHSSAVVLLAGMFAKELGVETGKSLETLGLACMLHDIGLYLVQEQEEEVISKSNKRFRSEEEIEERLKDPKCFAEEKKNLSHLLEKHAKWAVDYLSEVEGVNPVVMQIIAHHHAYDEKEKGTWSGGTIHPMAEILALSDRLVKLLKKFQQTGASKEYLKNALQSTMSVFPMRIQEVFLKTFNI
ncbi:MAG: hypothetical protein COW00_06680 [Bdellovibrio sp. CG12_big_fil_rev_8_21_14_0_65_39_13]|nr:MAG: hypothetical protein COW78_15660 [Bdellovibrio sp. CG22_combo_CG10-13_8_21_14_all_39_27]PIQ60466.1 MAG: hypothetical protein COW00_06680 [Bdellovibrio sp. CG12_big_fil_rev_8_21_14_0_65_39_13]PIR33875.1 MAG: hypothetical protein COV37_14870 [Bdellovibrio sp. CG11_big_fil_rev_8_21_14_0_20_39_38]